VEYIVLASSPGIAIQGLLDLFNNSSGETVFIKFTTLRDASSIRTFARPSARRTVFHGVYDAELIKNINATYPTTKNILLFDTAEAAILQELSNNDDAFSIDTCIDNWANCINQLSLFKEQNPTSTVLIDYASLINTTAQIIALVNQRLDIQLSNCPVSATSYSSIARLIAAAALINRDEAMMFYDDAKTLALTNQYDSSYTDAPSLVAKQQAAALNEFQSLLKCLQNDNSMKNTVLAVEQTQNELNKAHKTNKQLCKKITVHEETIISLQKENAEYENFREHLSIKNEELHTAHLTITQLREKIASMQTKINEFREDINTSININRLLTNKECELDIALLQLNQLQNELENHLEQYSFFESFPTDGRVMEKILGEMPLLGLLRNQANISI
jgi:hypothetical protein